eukprot:365126-Chlamydomonas_euryale.AAC.36
MAPRRGAGQPRAGSLTVTSGVCRSSSVAAPSASASAAAASASAGLHAASLASPDSPATASLRASAASVRVRANERCEMCRHARNASPASIMAAW